MVHTRMEARLDNLEKGFEARIDNLEVRFNNLERGFENLLEMVQNINQTLQQGGNSLGDSGIGAEGNLEGRNGSRSGATEERWRKLEIPLFSGDDVYEWVSRVERYFNLKGVLEQERLQAEQENKRKGSFENKEPGQREDSIDEEEEPVEETNIKIVVAKKEIETEVEMHVRTAEEFDKSQLSVEQPDWVACVVFETTPAEQVVNLLQNRDVVLFQNKRKRDAVKENNFLGLMGQTQLIQVVYLRTKSVLPGILQGDKSDSFLYGSVDNGRKICWNEDFYSKVSEAAKRLHLKEHLVLDGSGNVFKLAAPVECKGIVGGDDRHYLLDLLRAQAAETSKSKEKNFEGADDLASDSQNATDADKPDITEEEKIKDVKELTSSSTEASGCKEDIVFNPNVFTEFKPAGSPEEIAADEDNVRKISLYLIDVVLPKFVQDLCTLEVSPMDSQTFKQKLEAAFGEVFKGSWLQEGLRGFSFDPGGTWLSVATSYSP
ncbi:CLU domain [Sesbania bispinosa]|nr:CLU domain [Sesbania bispinosa]